MANTMTTQTTTIEGELSPEDCRDVAADMAEASRMYGEREGEAYDMLDRYTSYLKGAHTCR